MSDCPWALNLPGMPRTLDMASLDHLLPATTRTIDLDLMTSPLVIAMKASLLLCELPRKVPIQNLKLSLALSLFGT